MNNLTKSQVLALFLGLASAQDLTFSDLLNKTSSAENVPEGQKLTPAMTGSLCSGNTDCTQESEKCAQGQIVGTPQAQWQGLCVHEGFCNGQGRLNGNAYFLACYEDVAAGETPATPAAVDPAVYLTELEALITPPTINWDGQDNLIVSAKFNSQDGWFTEVEGKWTETDKPADNRCFLPSQCSEGSCCGYWPDENGRRCMLESLDKVEQSAGPVKFTPSCSVPDETATPENAQDDIAKGKLSEASGEIDKFFNNEKADKKAAAKYDEMSEEDKAEFDKKLDALDATRTEFKDTLKTLVGFDAETFGDGCKAIFEEEYLKYEKVRYEDCAKDTDGLYCDKADSLIKSAFESMKGDGTAEAKNYFCAGGDNTEMTDDERKEWKDAYNTQREKDGAALVALSVENGGPKSGEDGYSCGANGQCPVGSCCGNSKPSETQVMAANQVQGAISAWIDKLDAGATELIKSATGVETGSLTNPEGTITNVCVNMNGQGQNMGTQQEWIPIFDVKMIHTCQAIAKLATSAAAAGAALYYM